MLGKMGLPNIRHNNNIMTTGGINKFNGVRANVEENDNTKKNAGSRWKNISNDREDIFLQELGTKNIERGKVFTEVKSQLSLIHLCFS